MRKASFAFVPLAILFACGGESTTDHSPASNQRQMEQTGGADLFWFYTCGDPVCAVEQTDGSGIRPCTTEQAGNPCDPAGDVCDPGTGCGVRLLCTDRDPRPFPGGCPISREKYKEDIHYLASEDLDRYHDQLMSLPLATYRYREGGSRQRLGFMIDGHESLVCVEAERDMIDVYGYTSMAVAALKVQGRQIEELKATVESLHRKLEVGTATERKQKRP